MILFGGNAPPFVLIYIKDDIGQNPFHKGQLELVLYEPVQLLCVLEVTDANKIHIPCDVVNRPYLGILGDLLGHFLPFPLLRAEGDESNKTISYGFFVVEGNISLDDAHFFELFDVVID